MALSIAFTSHEAAELARFAQAAYQAGHNAIGHRVSRYAALPRGAEIPVPVFDAVKASYRRWLVDGEFTLPVVA